jgi:hypothetical protein
MSRLKGGALRSFRELSPYRFSKVSHLTSLAPSVSLNDEKGGKGRLYRLEFIDVSSVGGYPAPDVVLGVFPKNCVTLPVEQEV